MKAINILLMAVLILQFVNTAMAQTSDWDYNSKESYKNPQFLRESDPSKWDPKKVDWNNPLVYQNQKVYERKDIYSNPEVYKSQDFYKNLPADKYKSLDYKIVNFEMIQDHSKIDGNKYLKDLGCKSCQLSYEKGSSGKKGLIKYSKNGISHSQGDYISVPGSYSASKPVFKVTPTEIRIIPSSNNRLEIPLTDSVSVSGEKINIRYGSQEFNLDEGKASFNKGELFIKRGASAQINGVEIIPNMQNVRLFFDGNEHGNCACTYISMNKNSKVFVSGTAEKSSHYLVFKGLNPFIKMQSPLSITQDFGTISIQNRENKGLIPQITMRLNENQKYSGVNSIYDGATVIHAYSDGTIKQNIEQNSEQRKSNPLVFNLENKEGKSILGKKEPQRLIIDDNNRISTISYKTASSYEPMRLYFSLPEDVKVVAEKAREANAKMNEFKEEIKSDRGVAPMAVTGWLDDSREAPIIRALRSASEKSRFDASFFTAVSFNEGLNEFIDTNYYEDPTSRVSGFDALGLHVFGSEAQELKQKGLLRKDFYEYEPMEKVNRLGQRVKSAVFNDINYALEAFGATLSDRRNDFIKHAESSGYNTKELSEDQINYWTYLSYNCGQGCMRSRLQRDGIEVPKGQNMYGPAFTVGNSQRVLATTDLIKKAGLFQKGSSEQIALKK